MSILSRGVARRLMILMGALALAAAGAGRTQPFGPFGPIHATFTVNDPGDDSDSNIQDQACKTKNNTCTLRAALEQALVISLPVEIDLNLGAGAPAIQPATQLPNLKAGITLRRFGTTRPILDGYLLGSTGVGLELIGGGDTVAGLSLIRFQGAAITIGSDNNHIDDNLIGVTPSGTPAGNGVGVWINFSSGNWIGEGTPTSRNIIANNASSGVLIQGGSNNKILGDYIGLDDRGLVAQGNSGNGVDLQNTHGATVGGAKVADRNLIAANQDGIAIKDGGDNQVYGDYIGTDITGRAIIGNRGNGVSVSDSHDNYIGQPSLTLGTTLSGAQPPTDGQPPGNLIANNGRAGVLIIGATSTTNHVEGNYIGTDPTGRLPRGNGGDGVQIDGAPGTNIGVVGGKGGNLIVANAKTGVEISEITAKNTTLQHNWIGVDVTGLAPLGNQHTGVFVNSAPNTTIGGGSDLERNVISANGAAGTFSGVFIQGVPARFTRVQGNYIGLGVDGRTALGNYGDGVTISDAPDNLVGGIAAAPFAPRNLIAANLESGVTIDGAQSVRNHVEGNYIGVDISGLKAPVSPSGVHPQTLGVAIEDAPDNVIGGATSEFRNLISGHITHGVEISGVSATGNHIEGDYIGADITGKAALPNGQAGVLISNAPRNAVGATTPVAGAAPGNLISGNLAGHNVGAVQIEGSGAIGNSIKGNLIGLQEDGKSPLPNGYHGVFVTQDLTTNLLASQSKIGGPQREDGNVIAFNGGDGVAIDAAKSGPASTGNAIRSNLIYANKGLGIDLGAKFSPAAQSPRLKAGPLPLLNSGPNTGEQFPVLYLPPTGPAVGTLDAAPNTKVTLQFFASPIGDVSGYGQGQTFIDEMPLQTDPDGFLSFAHPRPPPGQVLSVTATDAGDNSSEFSKLACRGADLDPSFTESVEWMQQGASPALQGLASGLKPLLPVKYGDPRPVFLRVHVSKSNFDPQTDDFSKVFVSVTVRNFDQNGVVTGEALVRAEDQLLDKAGNADIEVSPNLTLKALAVGENKNFVEASVNLCYRGRVYSYASKNLLHLMLERTIVFLPGVLGSQIWVDDPSILPSIFSSPPRLAYPVPIGVVSVPFYTSWREYQAKYLDITRPATSLKLLRKVDLNTVPPFNLFLPASPSVLEFKVYDVAAQLTAAVDSKLPIVTIQGKRVAYYRLQAWPYDWRQKLEEDVAALGAPTHCALDPFAASGPQTCYGPDPAYAAPPSLPEILHDAQTNPAYSYGGAWFMDDHVTLVGHSTGGLIIRSALNQAAFSALVDRAYFINTPFQGAPKAYYAYLSGDLIPDLIAPDVLRGLAPSMPIVYYLAPSVGYRDDNGVDTTATPKIPTPGGVMVLYRKPGNGLPRQVYFRTSASAAGFMNEAATRVGLSSVWDPALATAADAFHAAIRSAKPVMGWENTKVFWSQGFATPGPAVVTLQNPSAPIGSPAGVAAFGTTKGDQTVPLSSQTGDQPRNVRGRVPAYVLEENKTQITPHDAAANAPIVWERIIAQLETPHMASFESTAPAVEMPNPVQDLTIYKPATIADREAIGEAVMGHVAASRGYQPITGPAGLARIRQGFDALYCNGKPVPQVTEPVYYACDGTLVVGEAKGGYAGQSLDAIMGEAYDYRQGTVEWGRKAAEFVIRPTPNDKTFIANQFLDNLRNGRRISMETFHVDFRTSSTNGPGETTRYVTDTFDPQ